MLVQVGLCQTWLETTLLVFSRGGSYVRPDMKATRKSFSLQIITYLSGSESGEETISRSASGGDKHGGDNSWAEDTDVSSAMDDHRKKVRIPF